MTTPEERVAQTVRRFMHQRLMNCSLTQFTVNEVKRLLVAPACYHPRFDGQAYTDQEEIFFEDLLKRIFPDRYPRCFIDHPGPCISSCYEK